MAESSPTISQTADQIRIALRDYIEATYHISHPVLLRQRRHLLDQEGVIFQPPFIESTPRYATGRPFSELALPDSAKVLFGQLTSGADRLLHDPPYTHQAEALELAARDGKSLVITTGTGSGKTESFLLPVLAKLAEEAATHPTSFHEPAVRALILYPMNALVNDQLGRLRTLLGDRRVAGQFTRWAERPARFARYTSRTLYPGVQTKEKDQSKLKSIEDFYLDLVDTSLDTNHPENRRRAQNLMSTLQTKGKWPAKPDLRAWYGSSGERWMHGTEFIRAVTQPGDIELLTRHEVLAAPPDILITNYSMLEYMLMRPLERPVFERTAAWLKANPAQRFLLVIDEAHLYRGSSGAEVALLLRRLTTRLGIGPDRLQVICTSASLNNHKTARHFAAQLTGKHVTDFQVVTDTKSMRPTPSTGSVEDARVLAETDVQGFQKADNEISRLGALQGLLSHLGYTTEPGHTARQALFGALEGFGPMSMLVNETMGNARRVTDLAPTIFPDVDQPIAEAAMSNLVALGSAARKNDDDAGLLPSRVHMFFRGLPGLWACLDPECPCLPEDMRDEKNPTGTLYAQPRAVCECGARVFELYTCRNCGTAYARAYTDDLASPRFLWQEGGTALQSASGTAQELAPLDLLLEEPDGSGFDRMSLDLITGELDPMRLGSRHRNVCLPQQRTGQEIDSDEGETTVSNGEFKPCGVCHQMATFGRSYVQDHQTKGDQPFQALISRQLEVQPPGHQPWSTFAPLQGRKVLAFSDSRQVAARLAPNLAEYSLRDVIRPLLLRGWHEMISTPTLAPSANLDAAYLAVMIGAKRLAVRLRPELRPGESLRAVDEVGRLIDRWEETKDTDCLDDLREVRDMPPEALLRSLFSTLTDRFYGLSALALASLKESRRAASELTGLSDLPGIATTPDTKTALVRMWLGHWTSQKSIVFAATPASWFQAKGGVRTVGGDFKAMQAWFGTTAIYRQFKKEWLPTLLQVFCRKESNSKYVLLASKTALETGGEWAYCARCRTVQRPFPGVNRCVSCQSSQVHVIDPDTDEVFRARKGYYRASTERALKDHPDGPTVSIVAAEHTAQLNEAQDQAVFSKAEENELLFQDIDLFPPRPAIDVLSCTTTMEVGIDIGSLSGVALRNMPPSRANYQQRAGRAGRRGNAVASVVAFGSSDTHDDHYFRNAADMISGEVIDPVLTMDNTDICRRHVTAFLLQQYHLDRLRVVTPEHENRQLFEVLGTVEQFTGHEALLNRDDFEDWLSSRQDELRTSVEGWLPNELSPQGRTSLLDGLVVSTLEAIDRALKQGARQSAPQGGRRKEQALQGVDDEGQGEDGAGMPTPSQRRVNLLDRLLYEGVLPRYAFPTDVVSFHVFDEANYAWFRPAFRYAPSQSLTVALSQYAPGKTVWIDNLEWTSGAIYSPMHRDLAKAWEEHKVYFECNVCHYAENREVSDAERGQILECPACKSPDAFGGGSGKGKSMNWMRPPGFAHRTSDDPGTSATDSPEPSYATRAKLVASGPLDLPKWTRISDRIIETSGRYKLLVTNTGPRGEGYNYCTICGLIEPSAGASGLVRSQHRKPFPDKDDPVCPSTRTATGIALGTDFVSDVLLMRFSASKGVSLDLRYLPTQVALRTIAEAITVAAADALDIEATEIQAEFRPALTAEGSRGREAEIYLYDTLEGGAGFTRQIHDLGEDVFRLALDRMENCPAGCDESCYRCLRSFRNKFDHRLLDRKVGAALLRHLLDGTPPDLDEERLLQSTNRLATAIDAMGDDSITLTRDTSVNVPGIGCVSVPILVEKGGRKTALYVCNPLVQSGAPSPQLREAEEMARGSELAVVPVNDIFVSKNLPHACEIALGSLG